jgi:hypothetical protein
MKIKGRKAGLAFIVCFALALGLATATPAGAAVATKWSKVWTKYLQPKADARYYTKATTDAKDAAVQAAATNAGAAAGAASSNAATDAKLGQYYKKTESDAKYAALGSSYTKAESDAKYVAKPTLVTGTFTASSAPVGGWALGEANYGAVFSSTPASHYMAPGAAPTAQCPGNSTVPNAAAGHTCFYAVQALGFATPYTFGDTPRGAFLAAQSTSATGYLWGYWASRPLGYSSQALTKGQLPEFGSAEPGR